MNDPKRAAIDEESAWLNAGQGDSTQQDQQDEPAIGQAQIDEESAWFNANSRN